MEAVLGVSGKRQGRVEHFTSIHMAPLIVSADTSSKERGRIIANLGSRLVRGKVGKAYDSLFGAFPPHRSILRLEHFNGKVFTRDYRKLVQRILLVGDLAYFYRYPNQIEDQFETTSQFTRENGAILEPWFHTTDKPNPHHLVPTSRGGNDNWKNVRYMDRAPHNDFHTVFQNLTPIEQLITMMVIHKKILNPEFVQDMKLLHREIGEPECYKAGVADRRRFE